MEKLDELVERYGENDAKAKELKKVCDADKAEIKEMMANQNLSKHTAGGYTVSYIVSEKSETNEAKMLDILKRDWVARNGSMQCPYIKTVEVIDTEALESALYKNELSEDVVAQLGTCTTTTQVVTLRCSKAKEKKDE